MGERLAISGNTTGQIIHSPLTDGERLQAVESFLAQPLPDECKQWGDAFNQDACDAWVAEAFPVKDHISYLINNQGISSDEALNLVGRWENLLGYDHSTADQGRVPYGIYASISQEMQDPQKPGYRYKYIDYHNRAVHPDGPHGGYVREGLGLTYGQPGVEAYKEMLPQLKAGKLVGLDYGGSDLTDVFGTLKSDASLAVEDGQLRVQMTVVDVRKKHYESPKEHPRFETPYEIIPEQSGGHTFKNVFDMLVGRKGGDYEGRERERNGEFIAQVLLKHTETWLALGDPELEQSIIAYIKKVVVDREEAEQKRLSNESTRHASWLTRQEHLVAQLALLTEGVALAAE